MGFSNLRKIGSWLPPSHKAPNFLNHTRTQKTSMDKEPSNFRNHKQQFMPSNPWTTSNTLQSVMPVEFAQKCVFFPKSHRYFIPTSAGLLGSPALAVRSSSLILELLLQLGSGDSLSPVCENELILQGGMWRSWTSLKGVVVQ